MRVGMNSNWTNFPLGVHDHVFLGADHERSERRTWVVIWLCAAMMILEIIGGLMFGSIALIADGLHMSTHAGALLLAALAYTYARKYAGDPRFTFGTGKLGDLAGFTSAIILAMITILIGYESVTRLFAPVPIRFSEAIPIACLGLAVNVASAWLLGGGHHHEPGHAHGHGHGHGQGDAGVHEEDVRRITTGFGDVILDIFEDGVPPRFRLRPDSGDRLITANVSVETIRPNDIRQIFAFRRQGPFLESIQEIPEPHAFDTVVTIGAEQFVETFKEHEHAHAGAHRDNNMRAAIVHVAADAAVSVLVIVGLLLARGFGWLWMDPVAGIVGAMVIASWAYGLVRDTGAILLDMNPDRRMADNLRATVEAEGDQLADLHLWRLGPGHLGAIVSIITRSSHDASFYRSKLARFHSLSRIRCFQATFCIAC
jgi:cation diffusion facilitator family transporter